MLTKEDKALLAEKGITEQQIEGQLKSFREGFPFLKLKAAASLDNGILASSADECKQYVNVWNSYKNYRYHSAFLRLYFASAPELFHSAVLHLKHPV